MWTVVEIAADKCCSVVDCYDHEKAKRYKELFNTLIDYAGQDSVRYHVAPSAGFMYTNEDSTEIYFDKETKGDRKCDDGAVASQIPQTDNDDDDDKLTKRFVRRLSAYALAGCNPLKVMNLIRSTSSYKRRDKLAVQLMREISSVSIELDTWHVIYRSYNWDDDRDFLFRRYNDYEEAKCYKNALCVLSDINEAYGKGWNCDFICVPDTGYYYRSKGGTWYDKRCVGDGVNNKRFVHGKTKVKSTTSIIKSLEYDYFPDDSSELPKCVDDDVLGTGSYYVSGKKIAKKMKKRAPDYMDYDELSQIIEYFENN